MNAQDLMADFAQRVGLRDFRLNEQGVASLSVDGKLSIHFEHRPERDMLHLYTVMMPVPATGRDALYETLLAANLFSQGADGAVFGVDQSRGEILLTRDLPLGELDGVGFAECVERFIRAAEVWQAKLAAPPPTESLIPRLAGYEDKLLRV